MDQDQSQNKTVNHNCTQEKEPPKPNHFLNTPLLPNYQQYGPPLSLPISLSDFFNLFLSNDSPYSLAAFNKHRRDTNKTLKKGVWIPIENVFFQGMTCKREMKWKF
jgi:hypothetical protein